MNVSSLEWQHAHSDHSHSTEGVAPACHSEESASIYWSIAIFHQEVDHDRKNQIPDLRGWKELPLKLWWSCCSAELFGSGCFLGTSLQRFSRHIPIGGDPRGIQNLLEILQEELDSETEQGIIRFLFCTSDHGWVVGSPLSGQLVLPLHQQQTSSVPLRTSPHTYGSVLGLTVLWSL